MDALHSVISAVWVNSCYAICWCYLLNSLEPKPVHTSNTPRIHPMQCSNLIESRRSLGSEDVLVGLRWVAVREREFEVLGEELADVWAADVVELLNFNDLEDLL